MFLAHMTRRWSVALSSSTSPLSLASLTSYQFFCLSCLYSLISRRVLAVENLLAPIMAPISSLLALSKLRYFLLDNDTDARDTAATDVESAGEGGGHGGGAKSKRGMDGWGGNIGV